MGLTVGMNERGGEGVCCPKKNSISLLRSKDLKVRLARSIEWC